MSKLHHCLTTRSISDKKSNRGGIVDWCAKYKSYVESTSWKSL